MVEERGGPRDAATAGAEMIERSQRSVVRACSGGRGVGAGVIWGDGGLVLTNAHVVIRGRTEVTLRDGRGFDAEIEKRSRALDLALLRLRDAPDDLPVAPVGDSDALRAGSLVYAIGHPWGRLGAVTAGVVSSAPAGIRGSRDERYVVSDLALAPGNSGGPLLNARGEVVGINTMISGRAAFSIPSNAATAWVAASEKRRQRLGVGLVPADLPAYVRRANPKMPQTGLVIAAIEKNSPAGRAGLLVGDVLLGAGDGLPYDPGRLPETVAGADGAVRLRLMRGGKIFFVDVDLRAPGRAA